MSLASLYTILNNVTTKTYVTGINHQNLCHHYTILNNVTTKTYVTGITIYNTLTRFIVTTKTYVTGITIYNTQQCNHQNLCHRHHYIQYSTM